MCVYYIIYMHCTYIHYILYINGILLNPQNNDIIGNADGLREYYA